MGIGSDMKARQVQNEGRLDIHSQLATNPLK